MRSQHDNTTLKRDTAARQTEEERDTHGRGFQGCLLPPQTWSPTFRLTFPQLQLGTVLRLRLPGTPGHTKLWMKRDLKSIISTWTLFNFLQFWWFSLLIFKAFFFVVHPLLSSCSNNFSFWKSKQVRIFQYVLLSPSLFFSVKSLPKCYRFCCFILQPCEVNNVLPGFHGTKLCICFGFCLFVFFCICLLLMFEICHGKTWWQKYSLAVLLPFLEKESAFPPPKIKSQAAID